MKTMQMRKEFFHHDTVIWTLVELPNHILVSGGNEGQVWLWDIETGKHIKSNVCRHHNGTGIQGMIVLRDGRLVTTCVSDTKLRVWHTQGLTTNETREISFDEYDLGYPITNVVLLYDGKTLAVSFLENAKSGHIYLCELGWDERQNRETCQLVKDIPAHDSSYAGYAMITLPTGEFVSTLHAPEIKIWNTLTGDYLTLNPIIDSTVHTGALMVTPDGMLIRGANNGILHFWDMQQKKCIKTHKDNHNGNYTYNTIVALKDGTVITASNYTHTVNSYKFFQRPLELRNIKPILKALKGNNSIRSLNLSGIALESEGVDLLIFFLENNNSLMVLDIRNTRIPPEDIPRLIEAIRSNKSLCFVELSDDALFPCVTFQECESVRRVLVKNRKQLPGVQPVNIKFPKLNIQTSSNAYLSRYKQLTEKWEKIILEDFTEIKDQINSAVIESMNYFQSHMGDISPNAFEFDIKIIEDVLKSVKTTNIDTTIIVNFASYSQSLLQNYVTQTTAMTQLIENPSGELGKLKNILNEVTHAVGSLTILRNHNTDNFNSIIDTIGTLTSNLREIGKKGLLSDIQKLENVFNPIFKLADIDLGNPKAIQQKLEEIGMNVFKLENLGNGLDVLGTILNFSGVSPKLVNQIVTIGKSAITIATSISQIAAGAAVAGPIGAIAGAVGAIFSLLSGPSKEEQMLENLSKQMQQGFEGLSKQIKESTEALAKLFCDGLNQLAQGINKNFQHLHDKLDTYQRRTEKRFDIIERLVIETHFETMKKLEVIQESINILREQGKTDRRILLELRVGINRLSEDIKILFEDSNINDYELLLGGAFNALPEQCQHNTKFIAKDAIYYCSQFEKYAQIHSKSSHFTEIQNNREVKEICNTIRTSGLERSINLLVNYSWINYGVGSDVQLCNFKFWARVAQDYIQFTDTCTYLMAFYKVDYESFQRFIDYRLENLSNIKQNGEEVKKFLLDLRTNNDLFKNLCNAYQEKITNLLDKIKTEDMLDSEDNLKKELEEINIAYEILVIYLSLAFNNDFAVNGILLNYLNKMGWTSKEFKGLIINNLFSKENKISLCETLSKYITSEINSLLLLIEEKTEKAKIVRETEYVILDKTLDELQIFEQKLNTLKNQVPEPKLLTSEFKSTLSTLIRKEKFSFKIIRQQPDKIVIRFATLKKHLFLSQGAVEERLQNLANLFRQECADKDLEKSVDLSIDLETKELIISSRDINVVNQVGNLLKEAGMGYWNEQQLISSQVFLFNPQNTVNNNQFIEDNINTIGCSVQ